MKARVFWDTSVLVPLCVEQPQHSKISNALAQKYGAIVWWGAAVEVISALTRLRRAAAISELRFTQAKSELDRLFNEWVVIAPTNLVEDRAKTLLETYPLRAADALQLAAGLEWCEGRPRGEIFLTTDRRLAEAARLAGFTLEPVL